MILLKSPYSADEGQAGHFDFEVSRPHIRKMAGTTLSLIAVSVAYLLVGGASAFVIPPQVRERAQIRLVHRSQHEHRHAGEMGDGVSSVLYET